MAVKNYKKRFIYSSGVFLLLSLIAWLGPVSQTLEVKRQKQTMENEMKKLEGAPQRIGFVRRQLGELDQLVGFNDSLHYDQRELFIQLSAIVMNHAVIIREVPESHLFTNKNMHIETHVFKLEGGYVDLVKSIHEMEQKVKSYHIVSANFYREQDKKTKKLRLIVELYIQGIRKV